MKSWPPIGGAVTTKKRLNFNAEIKARIAVEGIKGQRTIQEIGAHYGVHPNQVAKRKRQALELVPQLFSDHRLKGNETDEALKAKLYQQIGKLRCNWNRSKKSRNCWNRRKSSWIKAEYQNLSIVQQC